jgi:hypothetical protein
MSAKTLEIHHGEHHQPTLPDLRDIPLGIADGAARLGLVATYQSLLSDVARNSLRLEPFVHIRGVLAVIAGLL